MRQKATYLSKLKYQLMLVPIVDKESSPSQEETAFAFVFVTWSVALTISSSNIVGILANVTLNSVVVESILPIRKGFVVDVCCQILPVASTIQIVGQIHVAVSNRFVGIIVSGSDYDSWNYAATE